MVARGAATILDILNLKAGLSGGRAHGHPRERAFGPFRASAGYPYGENWLLAVRG